MSFSDLHNPSSTTRGSTVPPDEEQDVMESAEDLPLTAVGSEYLPGLHLAVPPASGFSGPKRVRSGPITITSIAITGVDRGFRRLVVRVTLWMLLVIGISALFYAVQF